MNTLQHLKTFWQNSRSTIKNNFGYNIQTVGLFLLFTHLALMYSLNIVSGWQSDDGARYIIVMLIIVSCISVLMLFAAATDSANRANIIHSMAWDLRSEKNMVEALTDELIDARAEVKLVEKRYNELIEEINSCKESELKVPEEGALFLEI